jgi:hypothetical protein
VELVFLGKVNIRNIANTGLIVTYIDASHSVKIMTDLGNYLETEMEDLTQVRLLMSATETFSSTSHIQNQCSHDPS